MKSLKESLFDTNLEEKDVPIALRQKYVKKLTDLLNKYNVSFEEHKNRMSESISYIIDITKIYTDSLNFHNTDCDVELKVHLEVVIPTDKAIEDELKDPIWKIYTPSLWCNVVDNGKLSDDKSYRARAHYNRYVSFKFVKYTEQYLIGGEQEFDDFLAKLENIIKKFNKPSFVKLADEMIDTRIRQQLVISQADLYKLKTLLK